MFNQFAVNQFVSLIFAAVLVVPTVAIAQLAKSNEGEKKLAVFLAGRPSHGYGSHEHYAGCMLLAQSLEAAMPNFETRVYKHDWPREEDALDNADVIIMYADGGGRHPVLQHKDQMQKQADRGCGIVCLHYAVEVPKAKGGKEFLEWIGGYFEMNWSVNPHWIANFEKFPDHPVANGIQPFSSDDEWYYNMRFRPKMENVTPILTAVPPKHTLERPDGPHSNNPHVRKMAGQPQHVAWASERENGGRGFGFTGGHNHWNWGEPNFRKLVLNAIVWSAKSDVPENGVVAKKKTIAELKENQDYDPPKNLDVERIKKKFNIDQQ